MRLSLKNKWMNKSDQPAQGMVEFALVLPILLMVMLGIFSFSHLLFSYTLVTAASREAARFGVATGLSDANLPRFRDCDAIRDAAIRVGSFAGVAPDNIDITYDKGPHLDGSPADVHPNDCPVGGIGPGYVQIGDRIVVTINVNYRPITPLSIIPELTLSSETKRTLIRTLPIGDAPIAGGVQCNGTITRIIPPAEGIFSTSSVFGQDASFTAQVIADDPTTIPPGSLRLFIDEDTYTTPFCSPVTTGTVSTITCTQTGWDDPTSLTVLGEHWIRAEFLPTNTTCPDGYNPSRAEPWLHTVAPADTEIIKFTYENLDEDPTSPGKILPGHRLNITVHVRAVPPGTGAPEGPVIIYEVLDDGTKNQIARLDVIKDLTIIGDVSSDTGSISFAGVGTHDIVAVFDPIALDENKAYNESPEASFGIDVEATGTRVEMAVTSPTGTIYPGDTVTINVDVISQAPETGVPTGTVTLFDDFGGATTDLGTLPLAMYDVLTGTARATFTTNFLEVGTHPLRAVYTPDSSTWTGSSGNLSVVVASTPLIATSTSISGIEPPAVVNVASTVTVQVTAATGTPTGTVELVLDGDTASPQSVTLIDGIGSFLVTFTSVGDHTLLAKYTGSDSYGSSESKLFPVNVLAEPYPSP